jgi:ribosome-associated protein
VIDDPMELAPGVRVPLSEIELRTSRSSGPGGQHANVTASRVEATLHIPSSRAFSEEQKRRLCARLGPVARATAQDTRSQARNRELALERLRSRLAGALSVPRKRRSTRPTAASRRKRAQAKRRQSERKRLRRRPNAEE